MGLDDTKDKTGNVMVALPGTPGSAEDAAMNNPSPVSHLYRLGFLLAAVGAIFVTAIVVFTPDSWNYDVWYRGDALQLNASEPLAYGGITDIATSKRNRSCKSCHAEQTKQVKKRKHKTLSCEACHGALADHAQDDKKIAVAYIDKSRWQCLNCHAALISRPKKFPQFTDEVSKHRTLEEETVCLKCHEAHNPTP